MPKRNNFGSKDYLPIIRRIYEDQSFWYLEFIKAAMLNSRLEKSLKKRQHAFYCRWNIPFFIMSFIIGLGIGIIL
jgi:hypothetical protein